MAFRYLHATRKAENLVFRLFSKKCTQYEAKRNLQWLSRLRIPSNSSTQSILRECFRLQGSSLKRIQVLCARNCSKKPVENSSDDDLNKKDDDSNKKDDDSNKKDEDEDEKEADKKSEEFRQSVAWSIAFVLASSLISYSTYQLYTSTISFNKKEMTWQEFVTNYLEIRKVSGYLEVVGDICLLHVYKPNMTEEMVGWFMIGDPDRFESKLQEAEYNLDIPPEARWKVNYRSRSKMMLTTLFRIDTFANVLFVVLALILLRRRLVQSKPQDSNLEQEMLSRQDPSYDLVKSDIRFADIAGCEEAKEEVMEFVSLLNNPSRYRKLGAKIPKGAILTGPPGTGKTLLAKATAGEANVPFIPVAGSEFIEIYIGQGPARVRELFKEAEKKAPCIIFIDEIDAAARTRTERSSNEADSTVNELLVQLDGMQSRKDIIVLAATNSVETIDKALLRPGRFDRQIYVSLPDIRGRFDLFKLYLKDKKTELDKEELAKELAAFSTGFSGADVANLCNEAALITARDGRKSIGKEDFDRAVDRVVAGIERKTRILNPREKKIVAYHEAGHAVAGWFLEHAPPVLKVSIIPTANALGYAMYSPLDMSLYTKEQLCDNICMALGGRVAEDVFFTDVTTGAKDDLDKATKIAYNQILRYGMGDSTGLISWSKVWPYSDNQSEIIDTEVKNLMKSMYTRTKELVMEHKDSVDKVAKILLEKEKIDRETLIETIGRRPFAEALTYDEILEKAKKTECKE